MSARVKTVLITGCTPGGIGSALAVAFHLKGLRVFASARSINKLKPLADKGIETLELDVSKAESISEVVKEVTRLTGGKLDLLINNAGSFLEQPALDADISDIRKMYETNVFGPMEMVRQFTPLLFTAGGTIVNISSILSIMPYPFAAAYNGSKAALGQYSETLRLELEPLNIKVVTVVTGQVATNLPTAPTIAETSIYKPVEAELHRRAKSHLDEAISPENYAEALAKHLLGGSGPWFWKGTSATITWIVSTFAPKTGFDFFMKKISGLKVARAEIYSRASSAWPTNIK